MKKIFWITIVVLITLGTVAYFAIAKNIFTRQEIVPSSNEIEVQTGEELTGTDDITIEIVTELTGENKTYNNQELGISFDYPLTREISVEDELERDGNGPIENKKAVRFGAGGHYNPIFMTISNNHPSAPRGWSDFDRATYIANDGEPSCTSKSEYYLQCEEKENQYGVKYLKYYHYDWLEMGDEDENNKKLQTFYEIYNPYSEFHGIVISDVNFLALLSSQSYFATLADYTIKDWTIVESFDSSMLEETINSIQFIK
ncbi:hypothetical protein AGMMS50249_6500 [candidate division SR1 bacterium]|nr:hypothetical protein AGMMS50249_6500 [candidate division SR1 bacterium]